MRKPEIETLLNRTNENYLKQLLDGEQFAKISAKSNVVQKK